MPKGKVQTRIITRLNDALLELRDTIVLDDDAKPYIEKAKQDIRIALLYLNSPSITIVESDYITMLVSQV